MRSIYLMTKKPEQISKQSRGSESRTGSCKIKLHKAQHTIFKDITRSNIILSGVYQSVTDIQTGAVT